VVTWRREHLRMDALVHRFPLGVNRALALVERLAVAGLAGFACVQMDPRFAGVGEIQQELDV
jgi:TRAP-type C4-dicarboxylate transport system permease small subunit